MQQSTLRSWVFSHTLCQYSRSTTNSHSAVPPAAPPPDDQKLSQVMEHLQIARLACRMAPYAEGRPGARQEQARWESPDSRPQLGHGRRLPGRGRPALAMQGHTPSPAAKLRCSNFGLPRGPRPLEHARGPPDYCAHQPARTLISKSGLTSLWNNSSKHKVRGYRVMVTQFTKMRLWTHEPDADGKVHVTVHCMGSISGKMTRHIR